MKNKIKKHIQLKSFTKGDFERNERARVKRTLFIPVDFQRLEEAQTSKFDYEVGGKILVEPLALKNLIEEEEKSLVLSALKEVSLSKLESECIRLTFEKGLRPIDIARRLQVRDTTVHAHLSRAIIKIRAFLKRKRIVE